MNNKLIMSVVGIAICVILVGSVLAPVVDEAQINAGAPLTVDNNKFDSYYTAPQNGDVITINNQGVSYNSTLVPGTYRGAMYADTVFISYFAPTDTSNGFFVGKDNVTHTLESGKTCTITFTAGNTYTISYDGVDYDLSYTWAYILCDESIASYATILDLRYAPGYITSSNDVLACGYYSTGENDTFYTYHNGAVYAGPFGGSANIVLDTLMEGSTDIYKIDENDVTLTIGGETFTPYIVLVPLTVTGHADHGGYSGLLAAILPIIIVSLIVSVIAVVRPRD